MPADRGTYKRYSALIDLLRSIGDVDCCCLVDQELRDGAETAMRERVARLHAPRVRFRPWRPLLAQMIDPLPPNVRHWQDPALVGGIRAFFADRRYDVVVLGDLVSIPYAEQAGLTRFPCWVDRSRVDWEFQRQKLERSDGGLARKCADRLRIRKTIRYERHVASRCAAEIVCADSDRVALARILDDAKPIHVVPNGIESQEFPDQGPLPEEPTVMIAGAMDYLPNVDGTLWYVHECWPEVLRRMPQARLLIVGRDPSPEIAALDGVDGTTVTGAVPSMLPWYRAARAVCAPIRIGGGTRLKVVEAWSVGRPLVATGVAVDGLRVRPGVDCLVADTATELAEATVAALQPGHADHLRQGALDAAVAYDWKRVLEPLGRALAEAKRAEAEVAS